MSRGRKVAAGGARIAIPPTALELSKKQMEGPMRNQVLAFHFTSCRSSLRLHRMFSGRFEVSVGRFWIVAAIAMVGMLCWNWAPSASAQTARHRKPERRRHRLHGSCGSRSDGHRRGNRYRRYPHADDERRSVHRPVPEAGRLYGFGLRPRTPVECDFGS